MISDADLYDKPKKDFDKIVYTVSLAIEYPFLRNLAMTLIHIGIHGEMNRSGDALVLSGGQLYEALKGAKVAKAHEYLQYLTGCGICFSGINLEEKKPDLSKVETLEVSYPDNNHMLIGLKIMALAQLENFKKRYKAETGSYSADVDGIFLRCDYRALGEEKIQPVLVLEDYVRAFSPEIQKNILNLNQKYMSQKFKCVTTIVNLINRFEYTYQGANAANFTL